MKIALTLALLIAFCSCTTERVSVNGDRPPRYAREVQVALYDSTPREPTTHLEMLASPDANGRPYRVIALLTREGFPNDEGLIMNAIAWRARQLGAEGLIQNATDRIWSRRRGGQVVFSASAIVFAPPPEPAPKP